MAYFSVVLARREGGWDGHDIDLDGVEDLSDLADLMHDARDDGSADPDEPLLLLLEHEDLWFAVVRVDGDEDPRVFVSDRTAVEHSAYAEMLLEAAAEEDEAADRAGDASADEDNDDEDSEEEDSDDAEQGGSAPLPDSGPVGDRDVLADLGTDPKTLVELCVREGSLPSEVVIHLAERAGAADALETAR